jgi:phosphate-selective porin OprO and OprP
MFSRLRKTIIGMAAGGGLALLLSTGYVHADPNELDEMKARIEKLEKQNEELRQLLMNNLRPAAPDGNGASQAPPADGAAPDKKQVEKIVVDVIKEQDKKKKDDDKKKKDEEDKKKKEAEEKGYDVGSDPKMTAQWKDFFATTFESAHKDFRYHVGGRFQQDTVFWHEPLALTQPTPIGVDPLDDGMFFRRIRLEMDGIAWQVMEFQVEFDLENLNDIRFDHIFAGLRDVPLLGTVRVGQHKVPFGLESFSTSKALPDMERSSLFNAFYQEFAPGIFASNNYYNQRLTWDAMFHRIVPTQFNGASFGDGEYAGTFRVAGTPIYQADGRYLLHLGASYMARTTQLDRTLTVAPGANRDVVRFLSRADIRDNVGAQGDADNFVDTGKIIGQGVQQANFEAMTYLGPFWIQSEATLAQVNDAVFPANRSGTAHGDPTFWGTYIMAGFFLTGDNRGYDKRFCRYDQVKPITNFWWVKDGEHGHCLGRGAWEVTYRYDFLDLNDRGIQGGLLTQHTLGLNWYLNPNLKVQWNYLHANRNVPSPLVSGSVDGLGMEIQLAF